GRDRPREMFGIVERARAGAEPELRHFLVVEIRAHRDVGGRSERAEDERDLVLLDELAGLLQALGRAVAVIEHDYVELASVDATLIVDHLEISGFGAPNLRKGRSRAAYRAGLAELDLGVRNARRILLLRLSRGATER